MPLSRAGLADRVATTAADRAARGSTGRIVVDADDPTAVAVALLVALEEGSGVAVLDPAWPQAIHRQATDRAHSSPRAGGAGGAGGDGDGGDGDLVVFTSGSAGTPRAVIRSAQSWQCSGRAFSELTGIGSGDVVWLPGPLSSSLFLYGLWHAVACGASALADPMAQDTSAVTAVHTTPAQLADLVRARPERHDLRALRTVVVAGAHLPDALARAATGCGWRVVEYYGAAELSFVAARRVEPGTGDCSGLMRAFPGCELQTRDDAGQVLVGRPGTLWVRSPYVSAGYLGGVDGPLRRDADGWASVGDVAELDQDGSLRVLGRGDTAVGTGAHTVLVEDVELVLAGVQGVAEVACLGISHPRLGQLLVAVVVPDKSVDVTVADLAGCLRAVAREQLTSAARPRRWLTCDALPRTSGGKVDRGALSAQSITAGRTVTAEPRTLRPLR